VEVEWTLDRPRRRRWPYLLGVLAAVAVVLLGVAGGAAKSTSDASSQAAQLRARGEFDQAITLYLQIAKRTGPLYTFARNAVAVAPLEEQKTVLAWASSLAAAGHVDQALRLASGVTDPALRTAAGTERAALLLAAAKAAAGAGDYGIALMRLEQLQSAEPQATVAVQVSALMPQYEVGQARALITAGRGADAVALLDRAAGQANSDKSAVNGVLPAALLAAGQEEVGALSFKEAAASLQRLTATFGGTRQARAARSLLGRHQPVAGTLTDRKGGAISGQIRLSSNFQTFGGGYVTSGPFFYSSADGNGNFFVDAVPLGGPYVLEVFHNGDWTTLIDPSSGRPADPVNVSALEPVDLTFIVLPS
jgi:hypothetical protein